MTLRLQPIDFAEACEFVRRLHRHHRPPLGAKFAVAANDGVEVVGVLIAGRPVSRNLDDGLTLEVTRVATDGTRNCCSLLYGAAWRAAKALGYTRMVTYTLPEEGGGLPPGERRPVGRGESGRGVGAERTGAGAGERPPARDEVAVGVDDGRNRSSIPRRQTRSADTESAVR